MPGTNRNQHKELESGINKIDQAAKADTSAKPAWALAAVRIGSPCLMTTMTSYGGLNFLGKRVFVNIIDVVIRQGLPILTAASAQAGFAEVLALAA